MFFHTYILTKRGPFAKIWLAAHWDRKLTKNDVRMINLSETVLNIIEPAVPIALRTSGELMLGVVRVYGHKVRVLLKEAQDVAQDLLRSHKDALLVGVTAAGGKTVIAKEVSSAVTNMDPPPLDFLATPLGTFEADFDAISNLVLPNKVDHGLRTIPRAIQQQDITDDWFQPPASQFQENLEDFSQELKFPLGEDSRGREESIPLSEHSKKSGSVPSIEELRKSATAPRTAEFDRLNMDIGLPLPDEELPEFPVLPTTPPPAGTDLLLDTHDNPREDTWAEPLGSAKKLKRTLGARLNVVDNRDTMLSSESYRSAMRDRSELLLPYYRQGPHSLQDTRRVQRLEQQSLHQSLTLLGGLEEWAPMQGWYEAAVAEGHGERVFPVAETGRRSARGGGEGEGVEMEMEMAPPVPEFDMTGMGVPELATLEEPAAPPTGLGEDAATPPRVSKRVREESNPELTLSSFKKASNVNGVMVFRMAMSGKTRAQVARSFADALVLASRGEVTIRQEKPYGEMYVTTVV